MFIQRILNLPKNKHFFLFGPRQTGKSTLLKKKFSKKNTLYYDLLQSELYRKLLANPEIIRKEILAKQKLNKLSNNVIIDEVQKVPQILDEVHFLIEEKVNCSFILSGSSSRKLKRYQANMLGGRAWSFKLFPFSYQEIKKTFNLFSAMKYGSLPNVFLSKDTSEKSELLRSYVETYMKEEIEIEANVRNLGAFLRFLPIAASQNGELVNYSNIARETSVASTTVKEYYKILEDTLLGFFLMPYHRSIRKRMVKHPKFYFFDPGIVTSLTNRLRVDLLEHTYAFGKAFEHFFILELMKLNYYHRLDLVISFYRTERGAEVDCIIETPNHKIIAVEIKSTTNPSSSLVRSLYSFKEKVTEAQLILACRIKEPQLINDVTVLPWSDALEYICSELL